MSTKEQVSIYLPEDLHREIKVFCAKNKLSMSFFIETVIKNYINYKGEKHEPRTAKD